MSTQYFGKGHFNYSVNRQHVIPLNDIQPHHSSIDCPCNPRLDEKNDIVMHNAFDGRDMEKDNESN